MCKRSLLCVILVCATSAAAGEPVHDLSKALKVPEGLEVKVWAQAPMFYNPTRMDADERGRIWVAEAVNYRSFNTKKGNPLWHERGDRIVILEDMDGDGKADSSKVFVQDKDLVAPLGVSVIGDKVVVTCSPHLIVYTRDQKDQVVKKEILLTGFGGFDHDHSLHKVESGPDGKWYFNVGNAGPHMVTDKAGWKLQSGSWYTGGSPYNTKNTPGLKSDDGRVWHGGLILRVNPDGTGLHVLGHGHRNEYGSTIDSFGDSWANDNDDTQSCRTTWLMKYGDLGYNSKDGTRSWQADKRPGQATAAAHWRQDDPGVIPSGHVYGNGSPTGIAYYENGSLGAGWDGGLLLSCEAGQNVVWAYQRKTKGAGFELEAIKFLRSTDEQDPNYQWGKKEVDTRKWFRPSDVTIGPDGAIYVCDWFDQIVGGHQMVDKAGGGTIYRITRKGENPKVPKVDLMTVQGVMATLKSPAPNVRQLARERILKDKGRYAEPLAEMLKDGDGHFAARAVWLLAEIDAGRLEPLLREPHTELTVAAYRALVAGGKDVPALAARMATSSSPAVRRETALSLRDLPVDVVRPIVAELAKRYDAQDRWYLEALGTACEGKEEILYAHLLGVMGGPTLRWSDAFADIAWRLHPVTAAPAFKDRALAGNLPPQRRKQAIDALAFIRDKAAALAMLEIATKGPEDLRPYAAWWSSHRANNDWKAFGAAAAPVAKNNLPGKPVFASAVLHKGHVEIDVDVTGASKLYLVADGGESVGCDWTDWINPVLIDGKGMVTKLTDLNWIGSENGWGEINKNKNCQGMPLKVGGVVYENGIGGHANMKLVYDIAGKGSRRFKARAGIDNGGPDLGGSDYKIPTSSARFFVYVEGPSARDVALASRKALLEATTDAAREQPALKLAGTAEGGRILIELANEGKLSDELKTSLSKAIFRNPDLSVRALASRHFPREGASLPSIDELAKIEGDATRGKKLFFSETVACAQCHRVGDQGRDVGPDLTKIQEKYDRRALLDSILNPNSAILVGYEAQLIETTDGDLFTGFILADADPLLLKDSAGVQQAIPRAKIKKRRQLQESLMPDNVGLNLTPQDLADLATYLQSPK